MQNIISHLKNAFAGIVLLIDRNSVLEMIAMLKRKNGGV